MRIALTYNVRITDSEEEAEFDSPGTHQLLAVITTVVRRTVNAYYVGSNPMPPANFVYAGVVVW